MNIDRPMGEMERSYVTVENDCDDLDEVRTEVEGEIVLATQLLQHGGVGVVNHLTNQDQHSFPVRREL